MQEIATFPFTFIGKTNLGKIFRPYAIVLAYSKARKKVEEILASPQKNSLPDKIKGRLEDIMLRADKELA